MTQCFAPVSPNYSISEFIYLLSGTCPQYFRLTNTTHHHRCSNNKMAQHTNCELSADQSHPNDTVLAGWTNDQYSASNKKRSKIIHAIIRYQRLEQLKTIVDSGWDVDEVLDPVDDWYRGYMPALHSAAREGWTDAVKMLLDAGAKCTPPNDIHNPLTLALQNYNCPPDLIKLLLEHGEDLNHHDGNPENIPLIIAISRGKKDTVQLLLQYGANPNVAYKTHMGDYGGKKWERFTALHEAAVSGRTEVVKMLIDAGAKVNSDENILAFTLQNSGSPVELIEILLKQGADVNYTVDWVGPLLHTIFTYRFRGHGPCIFLQQQLDLIFLKGGNINMEDDEDRTALEYAVRKGAHSNSIRWLIRHGADTSSEFTLFIRDFMFGSTGYFLKEPLVLLETGMRVPYETQVELRDLEAEMAAGTLGDSLNNRDRDLDCDIWDELDKADEKEYRRKHNNHKKSTFPQYWAQQMADLQEFSDETLDVYPEDIQMSSTKDRIHRILAFLHQPQSLQWYCRRCVRENLVSLQPSVVKTVPVPAMLKRYILCHEI